MRCEDCGPLLTEYVENQLPADHLSDVEEHLQQCAHCQRDLKQLQQWQNMGAHWQDMSVPDWSRSAGVMPARSKVTWPQWLSLGASTCALVLAALPFFSTPKSTSTTANVDGGISRTELAVKLDQFARLQKDELDNRFTSFEIEQGAHDKKMLTAALAWSREQQRDDMSQFVSYWKDVSTQDHDRQDKTIKRLANVQQLQLEELKASLKPNQSGEM